MNHTNSKSITKLPLWEKDLTMNLIQLISKLFFRRWIKLQFWWHNSSFILLIIELSIYKKQPVTVSARSKAWTVFTCSDAGIVGSNPTQGTDVCMCLFSVCVVLCLGRGLVAGWSLAKGALPSVKNDYGTEEEARVLSGLEEPLKK
jgi:putative exporter of polyketide antibiotics